MVKVRIFPLVKAIVIILVLVLTFHMLGSVNYQYSLSGNSTVEFVAITGGMIRTVSNWMGWEFILGLVYFAFKRIEKAVSGKSSNKPQLHVNGETPASPN